MTVALSLLVLVALLVVGVPFWVCLGLGTVAMLAATGVLPLTLVGEALFEGIDSFALIAIPLFILTGDVMVRSGLAYRLLGFAEAMRKGKLVSAATAERLWSAKPDLQSPDYGYGFGVGKDALGRRAGHSGGFPGIASVLDIYLDTGVTVVVLANVDGGMPPVAQKLRETAGRIR